MKLWPVLLLVSLEATAATKYVTNAGAGASDGSNEANAFAGFSDVVLDDGDTLCVVGVVRGTYTVADNSLVIDGECSGVSSTGKITGADTDTFSLSGSYYVSAGTYTSDPLWVFRNGVALQRVAHASLVAGQDKWSWDSNKVNLGVAPGSDTIEVTARSIWIDTNSKTGLTIRNLYFYGELEAASASGIKINGSTSITVYDNELYAAAHGIDVVNTSSSVTVRDNTLSYTCDGLDLNSTTGTNVTYLRNVISGCVPNHVDFVSAATASPDHECIASTNGGDGYKIIGNIISSCSKGVSIFQESQRQLVTVAGNKITDQDDDGINFWSDSSGVLTGYISGNLIYSIGNNLAGNIGIWGDGNASTTTMQMYVTNNTIADSLIAGGIAGADKTNFRYYNNIVFEPTSTQGVQYFINFASGGTVTAIGDGNVYVNDSGDTTNRWLWTNGSTYTTIADFRTASGQDANSQVDVSPSFNSDYSLSTSSALLGDGVSTYPCYMVGGHKCSGTLEPGSWQNGSIPYGYTIKPNKQLRR